MYYNVYRFDKIIIFLRKSLFNRFCINEIQIQNSVEICKALSVAMTKLHAPKKIELQFYGEMNEAMKQMTVDYKEAITALGVQVNINEDLLLQPSFVFRYLESLYLDFSCCDYTMASVFEAMLDKHASRLKTLKLYGLEEKVSVPPLPVLDSLELNSIGEEAARTILEQSRLTISSLVMHGVESPLFNNYVVYQIPNIKHLRLTWCKDIGFVMCNANHLTSLELGVIRGIPDDVVWPKFPNLRELTIYHNNLIPILINCRETLECLVMIGKYSSIYEYPDMVMPRLTDLYLHYANDAFSRKICNSNHRSLEFLYFCGKDVPNLIEGIRMESMRNVVLRDKTTQDREKMLGMCPNAEVVLYSRNNENEMRDMIRSRCKRRNFHCQFLTYQPFVEM